MARDYSEELEPFKELTVRLTQKLTNKSLDIDIPKHWRTGSKGLLEFEFDGIKESFEIHNAEELKEAMYDSLEQIDTPRLPSTPTLNTMNSQINNQNQTVSVVNSESLGLSFVGNSSFSKPNDLSMQKNKRELSFGDEKHLDKF